MKLSRRQLRKMIIRELNEQANYGGQANFGGPIFNYQEKGYSGDHPAHRTYNGRNSMGPFSVVVDTRQSNVIKTNPLVVDESHPSIRELIQFSQRYGGQTAFRDASGQLLVKDE